MADGAYGPGGQSEIAPSPVPGSRAEGAWIEGAQCAERAGASAHGPCDCVARNLSRRRRTTPGAPGPGVQRDQLGRRAVRPCLRHGSCADRVGWTRGLKAGVTKHTAAVLTASAPVDGVRKRRRWARARRVCMANGRGVEYEAGVKAAMAEARRASANLHAHGTSWASGLGGPEVGWRSSHVTRSSGHENA